MNILIVGATSAIAAACAKDWAEQNHAFFLVGRDEKKLEQVKNDLLVRGAASVTSFIMDVNNIAAHPDMLHAFLEGLNQIDIALIAHGTLPDQALCEKDIAHLQDAFATNALSTMALLSTIANQLELQRCGTLAVISSVAGDRGRQSNYVYGAAKAAVSTFCEGLRSRLYKVGAHVVTIKPGFVATPMTAGLDLPEKLVASPERASQSIRKAIERKANVAYVPGFWWLIMLVIRSIPHSILKKTKL